MTTDVWHIIFSMKEYSLIPWYTIDDECYGKENNIQANRSAP